MTELKSNSTTDQKATAINLDGSKYGTLAEIGAGQEVARHFFRVGYASKTIAKTMSAYDMTFSDAIYGKGNRYVSRERLEQMLTHEYDLVVERLKAKRGDTTAFFAFADTVTTSSHQENANCHGWMGVRFQRQANGKFHDIVIHIRMLDRARLQQQEALGVLGVNLIYASFYCTQNVESFVAALTSNLPHDRIEIDFVDVSGPDFDQLDPRIINLELTSRHYCSAAIFGGDGDTLPPSDALYGRPLLVQRGTFRPVSNGNIEILDRGLKQMKASLGAEVKDPLVLLEISLDSARVGEKIDYQDILHRVATMNMLGHNVIVSRFKLFFELKVYLRRKTDQWIMLVMGGSHLENLFDENYYKNLQGGILKAFGKLFDDKTAVYVFPLKTDLKCLDIRTFNPKKNLAALFQYLVDNNKILEMSDCENIDTSIHSADIRKMLQQGDRKWEKLVPTKIRDYINKHKCFV